MIQIYMSSYISTLLIDSFALTKTYGPTKAAKSGGARADDDFSIMLGCLQSAKFAFLLCCCESEQRLDRVTSSRCCGSIAAHSRVKVF